MTPRELEAVKARLRVHLALWVAARVAALGFVLVGFFLWARYGFAGFVAALVLAFIVLKAGPEPAGDLDKLTSGKR